MSANWTEKSMIALSQEEKRRKLRELAQDGGHASVVEMFKHA
jgi:hypothetical protein